MNKLRTVRMACVLALFTLALSGCKLPWEQESMRIHKDEAFTDALNGLYAKPIWRGDNPIYYYNKGMSDGTCHVYAGEGVVDKNTLPMRKHELTLDHGCVFGGFMRVLVVYESSGKFSVYSWNATKEARDTIMSKRLQKTALTPEELYKAVDSIYKYIDHKRVLAAKKAS